MWLLALALAGSASAQALPPEVQVGTREIKDYEFDSARDGSYCATCNGGAGNSRLAYIDTDHNLWVGQLDFGNGDFKPRTGKGTLVDTNAVTPNEIGNGGPVGNGPERMTSKLGSQLVYSRWTDGKPRANPNIPLGFARMGGVSWIAGPIEGSAGRLLPEVLHHRERPVHLLQPLPAPDRGRAARQRRRVQVRYPTRSL